MKLEPADVDRLDFAKGDGLLPVVVQDAANGAVLMLGYMNVDAARATLARRRVVFFSRSRERLWEKGETSGHTLDLVSLSMDCDRDTLLALVHPRGPTCHLGTPTCFGDGRESAASRLAFLGQLEAIVERRVTASPEKSYTARLFAQGPKRLAQKVGEEGVEVALAATAGGDEELVNESADLLFHLLLVLKSRGLGLAHVVAELEARHVQRVSGSESVSR